MSTRPLDNARAARQQLQALLGIPVISDRDRAGVIQAFEFTFEATWKLFKAIAEAEGLNAESPRRALTAAHRLGIVEDEATWLEMLQHRNLTSHVYHAALASEIFVAIRDRYAAALSAAVERAGLQIIG
jgi:nucleotidyltransferase substrate binding protein (TIGR01987 family)